MGPRRAGPPRRGRGLALEGSRFWSSWRAPRLGHRLVIIARHQLVDDAVQLVPIGLAEGVIADDEGGASVYLFILLVTSGELRADEIPGELEQLHAAHRIGLGRLE